jgi:hypothetical protein
MGARTESILIELSEDSTGRSPLFNYCSVIATSVVGVAATDMVVLLWTTLYCHPDQLYRVLQFAKVIPDTIVIPIYVTYPLRKNKSKKEIQISTFQTSSVCKITIQSVNTKYN